MEQIIIVPYKTLNTKGYRKINITTNGLDGYRYLHPRFIQNVYCYDGLRSSTLETAWHFSQIHKKHDNGGVPNEEYTSWRDFGWGLKDFRGSKYSPALYTWWDGRRFDNKEARKRIQIPLYERSIIGGEPFETLKREYERGMPIALMGYRSDDFSAGIDVKTILNDETKELDMAYIVYNILVNG